MPVLLPERASHPERGESVLRRAETVRAVETPSKETSPARLPSRMPSPNENPAVGVVWASASLGPAALAFSTLSPSHRGGYGQ